MKRSKATKSQLKRERKRKRLRKLKAACLSLGLATAWGADAAADTVPVKLSVTPQTNLLSAYVMYGNNFSSGDIRSLGAISAGQTTVFMHETDDDFEAEPPTFSFIGLYETGGDPGVTVSFQTDDVITNMTPWESLFSETEDSVRDVMVDGRQPRSFLRQYGLPVYSGGEIIAVDFGTTGTLVNFSGPTFGGTVSVNIVPEPATLVMLVSAVGVVTTMRQRD